MFKKIREYFFPFLVALSAFALAGSAGFFSVTGLSKLFGGAPGAVIIMASCLEFSKLVTASFLHKYWKEIDWKLKTYLTIGTVTIMFITSAGIYGFLSSAYSETSNKLEIHDGEVNILATKKEMFEKTILDNKKVIDSKNKRLEQLGNFSDRQENRLDQAISNRGQKGARKDIENTRNEIQKISVDIDNLNLKNSILNDSVSKYNIAILDLKSNNDIAGEVGPLKYIAKLTGYSMDAVVNFFILLLIFVFDPLAVCLVIATNISLEKAGLKSLADIVPKKKEEEVEEKQDDVETDLVEEHKEVEIIEEESTENSESLETDLAEEHKEVETVEEEPKKVEDKIEYKTNDKGEFVEQETGHHISSEEAVQILNNIKNNGIEVNDKYLTFLDALFVGGSLKVGDTLPPYLTFVENLRKQGVEHESKEVLDFLTICNLLKVTDMNGSDRRVAKEYEVAKSIFKVLSVK